MESYRLATKNELNEIATLFTESFLEYPLFTYILAGSNHYKQLLFKLNYINTRCFFQQKSCFVGTLDGKIVSVILLKKRGSHSPTLVQYLRNGGLSLLTQIGLRRLIKLIRTLEHMKEACMKDSKESWYVEGLAVAKGYQGRNLGSKLFESFIFPYISEQGGGRLTLVTHTELNTKFYRKNGFEIFSEYRIGSDDNHITNYSLQRNIGLK
ncbi:Acetyltransferase (GNAT) family protein [Amphibacillus marinus]|uniref:Acetyltransferase (GNAT) family protein n=1 Tax=Amphibacillus marinus TaxID=872970 RepID=A0A1H8KJV9_9BACI|nr:GNAT family N-acetyltransferase [Amphibacillus marinus]SEN93174.1 Acetyltransferase (GNAT) family protein [Amphibacillus marinus]